MRHIKKIFFLAIIIVLPFMTMSTYLLIRQLKVCKEIIVTQRENSESDRKNEILSYLKPNINIFDLEVLLINKDTINFKYNKFMNPILLYYFSAKDCRTCVEENIEFLVKCFSVEDSIDIVVASSELYYRDLYLKQRVSHNSHVKYGILKNIPSNRTHFFVFVNEWGQQSNVYYPVKGKSKTTIEYLRRIREFILKKTVMK